MCGRYKLSETYDHIARLFNLTNSDNLAARHNIASTQGALVLTGGARVRTADLLITNQLPTTNIGHFLCAFRGSNRPPLSTQI